MSKKIIRLKESELKRYIRKIISEQNSPELPDGDNKGAYVKSSTRQRDPKRIQFFDNLAKQISTKIVGKKYFFGKIGVLDNTSIIVKNYNDRNHSINLSGEPVKEFNLFFNVIRVEEDLYKNEKPGTRVWTGAIQVSAKFVNGKLSPNPIVELWGIKNGKIDFSLNAMIPSKPWTWDMVGGAELWMSSTKFNTQYN